MELLDRLDIRQGSEIKFIELYLGDLADMRPDEAVDILVVSAFPDDYVPTPSSLIGALQSRGVSVAGLACAKAVDLRKTCSCWLSTPLVSKPSGIAFDRILCFEPLVRGNPAEVVGDIFRSLVPFLGADGMGTTVAMPLVACGDQRMPIAWMLSSLLDAAINWMSHGLPLDRLKIVVHKPKKADEAKIAFAKLKARHLTPPVNAAPKPAPEFGVFISYAHEDWDRVSVIVEELKERRESLKVFVYREIDIGAAWQQRLFEALENCKKMIAVFSPAYLASKWCKEEYNIAHCRQLESGNPIIYPVLLYSTNLPYYMRMTNYVDCREGDVGRLRSCCNEFLSTIIADPA
jgi:hypothetical protein